MRAVRLRSVLLALALVVGTACSSGSAAPADPRVFHVGLFHVGLDHVPRSLQGLEDAHPSDPAAGAFVEEARAAAAALDLVLVVRSVADEAEINRVFDELEPGDVDGVMTASQVVQTKFSELLIDLSRSHGLPFMVADRSRVEKGGLLSYGPDFRAVGRAAAVYVDRILKGTKPADLPVEKMTQRELVINQAVAVELGLDLSPKWLDAAALVIAK
jgi:putative ABC transport system substrate-binding protein